LTNIYFLNFAIEQIGVMEQPFNKTFNVSDLYWPAQECWLKTTSIYYIFWTMQTPVTFLSQ